MRLIFIRHAEPDYENRTLTEKGFREAKILGERAAKWNAEAIYASPLERAQLTAEPSAKALGMEITTCEWLKEFLYPVEKELHPRHKGIFWDLTPAYINEHPELYDREGWKTNEIARSGGLGEIYDDVCARFDGLLEKHGYKREGLMYRSDETHIPSDAHFGYDGHTIEYMQKSHPEYTEKNLLFFAHFGISAILISHLVNCSPVVMLQGFVMPTSSVNAVLGEESYPGLTAFRVQSIGDASHLTQAGEPISYYGAFAPMFQG